MGIFADEQFEPYCELFIWRHTYFFDCSIGHATVEHYGIQLQPQPRPECMLLLQSGQFIPTSSNVSVDGNGGILFACSQICPRRSPNMPFPNHLIWGHRAASFGKLEFRGFECLSSCRFCGQRTLDWWSRVIGEWNKRGRPNGRLLRKKIIRAYTYWVWGGTGPSYAFHSPIL